MLIMIIYTNCYTPDIFICNRDISPVENKNDLELDFKVFFFTDSCCSDIVHDESNWCHPGIIERFEKLKMASKMAVRYAPNTYLTNRFDKRALILTFYGWWEAKWYRQLKLNIDSIQKVEILKMAPKMAVI